MGYWEERWAADALRAYRAAEDVIADVDRLHKRAQGRIVSMVKRIRRRFQTAYALTEEKAKELLSDPVGREEYLKLLEEIGRLGEKNPMRDALLAKAAAPAYAYRISLAEGMLAELDAITARLAGQEEEIVREHLIAQAVEKSKRAGYLIELEAGVGFKFNAISKELARDMIQRPWSGMAFSARIWRNREALTELLGEVLTEGLTAGNSAEAMAKEIAERMGVAMHRARTLVRTETTYVCNRADTLAYEETGVEKYRYVATLDMRTSKICRSLDGKVFHVKDAVPGKNYPPMHPNCRSITRADITEEELENMTRWSRDPVTGESVKVPANMTYEEWLKMQQETYGEERMRAAQKMVDNKASDRKQFKQYQDILGKKQLPDTLEKFQIMKYTEPDEWRETKETYRAVKWQKEALKNRATGKVHKVPIVGPANSVFDNYADGKLESRRYYGKSGKARLDIDLTDHGNAAMHKIVPHAHNWKDAGGDSLKREKGERELTRAEMIANADILGRRGKENG